MNREADNGSAWQALVDNKLRQLRYGTIQLVVHDGRVVQVDCTERTRLQDHENLNADERRPARR